jgi:hypothetical protein
MKFVAFWEYYPEDFEKLMEKKTKRSDKIDYSIQTSIQRISISRIKLA